MSGQGVGRAPDAAPRIELLAPLVADQIAAGEVIERPASVVKELVENALDAEATEVHVALEDGGRRLIAVRDDGFGMSSLDAERACLRHATSKLRAIDDLGTIRSFGFRGEALASIAAVAEVVLTTCQAGAGAGVRVSLKSGAVRESAPCAAPRGTTIEVRELFAALPARRKFLRSAQTETGHIAEWLQRIALARPDVGFTCVQGGREVLRYPAVGRGEDRLRQVLGAARVKAMVPVEREEGPVAVRGWISRAGESFAQARHLLSYVNGRLVRDRLLIRAILDAYRSLLPKGAYPAAVLRLELPGTAVDVNVHPTKTEVRFAQSDAVYGAVVRALRAALDAAAGAPGPRPGAPALGGPAGAPVGRVAGAAAPSGAAAESAAGWGAPHPAAGGAPLGPPTAAPAPSRTAGVAEALARYAQRGAPREPTLPLGRGPAVPLRDAAHEPVAPGSAAEHAAPIAAELAESPAVAAGLDVARFADLRVVGQAWNGYLVCEAPAALVLIDQHAAHERVRFERLRRAAASAGDPPSQRLLVPRVVELGEAASAAVLEIAPALERAGFDVEHFGERSLLVRAIPASLDVTTDAEKLLADLATDLSELGATERLEAAGDALLARVACHGAVRVGDPLREAEMARLLADLDTIPFAATCPHGRPLLLELPRGELERRVRRA